MIIQVLNNYNYKKNQIYPFESNSMTFILVFTPSLSIPTPVMTPITSAYITWINISIRLKFIIIRI